MPISQSHLAESRLGRDPTIVSETQQNTRRRLHFACKTSTARSGSVRHHHVGAVTSLEA